MKYDISYKKTRDWNFFFCKTIEKKKNSSRVKKDAQQNKTMLRVWSYARGSVRLDTGQQCDNKFNAPFT